MRFAFGKDKDEREILRIALKNYQEYGMMGHEWIRLMGLTKSELEELSSRIHVEGEEYLMAARKRSPSVILLGSHFGNWEYAHLFFANKINYLNFIVRRLDNPFLEQERVAYNQRFGVRILYKENGLREALRNLKKGEDLIIFPDVQANLQEGIPSQFFGQKTSTIPLVTALAKKYQIPVVPMFIARSRDRTHHKILFLPELFPGGPGEELSVSDGTQIQNHVIEGIIRRYPDHWLWFHRKWKCYHPEIYKT